MRRFEKIPRPHGTAEDRGKVSARFADFGQCMRFLPLVLGLCSLCSGVFTTAAFCIHHSFCCLLLWKLFLVFQTDSVRLPHFQPQSNTRATPEPSPLPCPVVPHHPQKCWSKRSCRDRERLTVHPSHIHGGRHPTSLSELQRDSHFPRTFCRRFKGSVGPFGIQILVRQ